MSEGGMSEDEMSEGGMSEGGISEGGISKRWLKLCKLRGRIPGKGVTIGG